MKKLAMTIKLEDPGRRRSGALLMVGWMVVSAALIDMLTAGAGLGPGAGWLSLVFFVAAKCGVVLAIGGLLFCIAGALRDKTLRPALTCWLIGFIALPALAGGLSFVSSIPAGLFRPPRFLS